MEKEVENVNHDTKFIKRFYSNKTLFFSIVFLVLAFCCIGLFFIFTPRIELKGNKNIVLNYGEEYIEPGYKAKYLNKDITDKVYIYSNVDVNKLGDYVIEYNIRKNKIIATAERKVSVVDKEKPVIELVGESSIDICPNAVYEELGFSSKDNYDGDLTDKVKVDIKENEVIYEVSDSSNNLVSINRTINRVDNEAPNITLKGGTTYYLKRYAKFSEPGFSASDNCDNDLTSNVTVSGEVNSNVVGDYDLVYTVSDSFGNSNSVTRKVKVYNDPSTNPEIKGVIYLTFDDGPSGTITPALLDILKEKNVKATFFVINHSSDLDYLIKREYDEGHTVALHSMTHDYGKIYSSVDAYFNDLNSISNKVERITGEKSMIIRFPGGSSNTVSRRYASGIMSTLTKEVLNRGYHYFDWNVSSGDAGGAKNSQDVYNNVVNGLSKNRSNIVLLHDFESNYKTLNAISDIIDYGKANGYEFLTIDMSTSMVRHSVNN